MFLPLISGIVSLALVDAPQLPMGQESGQAEAQQHESGSARARAEVRKGQVEHGLLPHVIFDGESKPDSVEARMLKYKTPALSVAVVHKGKLDWSAAWGKLQKEGAPANCDSLFQSGSLAKPVTFLAALRMKDAGLIDFDRSIESYLVSYHLPPGRHTEADPVNFRRLLAHKAGITPGGYAGYAQNAPMPSDQAILRGEAPSNSRKVEVLNTPGASLSYSGGGYTLIEVALQDQLHEPFDKIMREWLLTPVGMKQADFSVPLPAARHSNTARGHQVDGTMVPGGWNNYPEQAAAGLWATASDLALLLVEIHKGYEGSSQVFTQASIREMLANPVQGHAYGFRLMGEGDQVFITHYGGTVGYRAGMTLNVRTGDGAVFLANSDDASNLGDEFFSAVSRVYDWPVFRGENVKRIQQPAAALKSLTGNYLFQEQGWMVSVVYEYDALTLVFPKGNRDSLVLVPIEGGALKFVHETGVHVRFEGEGQDMKLQLYGQTGTRQPRGE